MGERSENFDENDGMTPEEIVLPRVSIPEDSLNEIADFIANAEPEGDRMSYAIRKLLQVIYAKYGKDGSDEEIGSAVIAHVQRVHKWDLEVLAEKKDVEDMFFNMFSHYDEHIWDKFINTQALSDLHHEVYKLSREYMEIGLREIMARESSRDYPEISRGAHEEHHDIFLDDIDEEDMMWVEFDNDDDDDVF